MSPEEDDVREAFRAMDVVALLEYAYDALADEPPGVSGQLAQLRWQEFGRLADRIAQASAAPYLGSVDEVELLRDFCFNEELVRPRMSGAGFSDV
jgi:hypothetical protein